MNSFTFEGRNRFYIGASAILLEDSREIASEWASKHIITNPAHSYILGKFVEADRANNNQQYFTLQGLKAGQHTITNAPMNINHSARNIVGSFVASEVVYPMSEESQEINPFIESLGVFWRYYFPDEYRTVKAAHDTGNLFYSMECVPRALHTVGGADDTIEYPYEGVQSPSYPDEINKRLVPINLVDPHFVGGALIIPPAKPGWSNAEVKSIASFMKDRWQEAERAYESIKESASHLDSSTWELMMGELIRMDQSREFTQEERDAMAKKGHALPDGSFPISNVQDLKNAIQAVGRAKDRNAAIAHIKKRARALGQSDLIPEGW